MRNKRACVISFVHFLIATLVRVIALGIYLLKVCVISTIAIAHTIQVLVCICSNVFIFITCNIYSAINSYFTNQRTITEPLYPNYVLHHLCSICFCRRNNCVINQIITLHETLKALSAC